LIETSSSSPDRLATRLDRGYYVLKNYRLGQIARRARKLSLGRFRQFRPPRYSEKIVRVKAADRFAKLLDFRTASLTPNQRQDPRNIRHNGQLRLLNQPIDLGFPIDWRLSGSPQTSHLWRFHLHYQEYLLGLVTEASQSFDRRLAWELVFDWIKNHPKADRQSGNDAWHPYCISRRMPIWMMIHSQGIPEGFEEQRFLESLFLQAGFLSQNLEFDLRGNHLLENLRALVFAGFFFEGSLATQWLAQAKELLHAELKEQVLDHGEHFERAPMYHGHVASILYEIAVLAEGIDPELTELARCNLAPMLLFLKNICHPDGEIPLLGDSCMGEAISSRVLLGKGQGGSDVDTPNTNQNVLETGGYWIFQSGSDKMIFDAASVGPSHLPAHAHCDLLGFEASIEGRRLFVDSGLYNYEDDAMRQYCRSSSAHNVMVVDGRNQCDVWSKFRMGFRGEPSPLQSGTQDGFSWASAEHDGYRRLGLASVSRLLGCREDAWFCLDYAKGQKSHLFESYLHLHPSVVITEESENLFRIELDTQERWLTVCGAQDVAILSGWYCEEFGKRVESPVLRWSAQSTSVTFGWFLTRKPSQIDLRLDQGLGGKTLTWIAEGIKQFEFNRSLH